MRGWIVGRRCSILRALRDVFYRYLQWSSCAHVSQRKTWYNILSVLISVLSHGKPVMSCRQGAIWFHVNGMRERWFILASSPAREATGIVRLSYIQRRKIVEYFSSHNLIDTKVLPYIMSCDAKETMEDYAWQSRGVFAPRCARHRGKIAWVIWMISTPTWFVIWDSWRFIRLDHNTFSKKHTYFHIIWSTTVSKIIMPV